MTRPLVFAGDTVTAWNRDGESREIPVTNSGGLLGVARQMLVGEYVEWDYPLHGSSIARMRPMKFAGRKQPNGRYHVWRIG